MARFLTHIYFTEQGIKAVGKSTQRADRFRSTVEGAGGKVEAMYWALGEFDGAVVFSTPDEQAAARLLVQLGQEGNVRTKTTQVFDANEFAAIAAGR
jgi:uncharacterized protein with GYD domain